MESAELGALNASLSDIIILPGIEVARLARSFASISVDDIAVGKWAHGSQHYAQAIYHLQQSVEKSAKAIGLLTGSVKPNNRELARQVGHRSLYSVMLHSDELITRQEKAGGNIRLSSGHPGETSSPAGDILDFAERLANITRAPVLLSGDPRERLTRLENLKEQEMWTATLMLDDTIPEVRLSLKRLEPSSLDKMWTNAKIRLVFKSFRLIGVDPRIEYPYEILKASLRIFPLCFLTMWHEKTTRYPPVEKSDYWQDETYTDDKPLVKIYPELLRHASILSKQALKSCEIAVNLQT